MVARDRLEVFSEEQDSMRNAQRRMKKYVDQRRRSVEFSVSEKVLLKLTPQIMKQIVTKPRHWGLIPKYDGPFEVVKRVDADDPDKNRSKRDPPSIPTQFDVEI
ncbi:hypothetical protein MTR67_026500 [Solanum verrucosum]|uniref:Uncharacterized protein n=1 Tax=Solanum verrucosum TaxID=315347 RepID=A0AAF0TZ81_SOLVR|nr:hypothetical protein MTR67_026500 [Solanum verrucosum]